MVGDGVSIDPTSSSSRPRATHSRADALGGSRVTIASSQASRSSRTGLDTVRLKGNGFNARQDRRHRPRGRRADRLRCGLRRHPREEPPLTQVIITSGDRVAGMQSASGVAWTAGADTPLNITLTNGVAATSRRQQRRTRLRSRSESIRCMRVPPRARRAAPNGSGPTFSCDSSRAVSGVSEQRRVNRAASNKRTRAASSASWGFEIARGSRRDHRVRSRCG